MWTNNGVDWTDLAEVRAQWRAVVSTVMNQCFSKRWKIRD
jgi:hypothetical protein